MITELYLKVQSKDVSVLLSPRLQDRLSLCSCGLPGTHYVDQDESMSHCSWQSKKWFCSTKKVGFSLRRLPASEETPWEHEGMGVPLQFVGDWCYKLILSYVSFLSTCVDPGPALSQAGPEKEQQTSQSAAVFRVLTS